MSPFLRNRTWLIKYYFFKKDGDNLKEIGDTLREARENMGVSIEEAANDLKLRPSQIENIESGKAEAFKDVYYLKYFVRDYSKYLGLSYEDMVDEFNEYLFDCTSKLSLEEIMKQKKNLEKGKKDKEKRIASPYTIERRMAHKWAVILLTILAVMIFAIILVAIIGKNQNNKKKNDNILSTWNVVESGENL